MTTQSSAKINISRREIRVLLLHEFRLGHKASEAANKICSTMGPDVLSIRTAQLWFDRFRNGNYELDDQPRSGRPLEVDIDQLKQLVEQDPRLTTRCLAEQLGCSHTTVEKHLADLGKRWKYGVWIPHELSSYQLQSRVDICMDLITSHRNNQWLRNLITGDEKWVLYVNHTHRRQWLSSGEAGVATPRMDLHPKKVMLSVWWGVRGIVYWELLPNGCTITSDLYCQQLDRLAQKLKGKQDRVYFLHDNARPHVAKSTREKLLQLGWITIPHPAYSPDLAPTDYHLFRSLSNYMREKKFPDENDLKLNLENFFNNKSLDFYERGIVSLPDRWRQVIDSDGAYIVEN
jgi:[histone H3]-lysine36 N-dimethyltransferase SETMAR